MFLVGFPFRKEIRDIARPEPLECWPHVIGQPLFVGKFLLKHGFEVGKRSLQFAGVDACMVLAAGADPIVLSYEIHRPEGFEDGAPLGRGRG